MADLYAAFLGWHWWQYVLLVYAVGYVVAVPTMVDAIRHTATMSPEEEAEVPADELAETQETLTKMRAIGARFPALLVVIILVSCLKWPKPVAVNMFHRIDWWIHRQRCRCEDCKGARR